MRPTSTDIAARRRSGANPGVNGTEPDRETRARLLGEAKRLFGAKGFRQVTVREICAAARANVAAINYHFGDKRGLYQEILDEAVGVMKETTAQARQAGAGGTAEEKLRAYIHVFVQRVGSRGGTHSWIHQIMTHEMAEPTDALDDVVKAVIEPRISYIRELVGEMLGLPATDDRVLRCVLSVQSQFHGAMANPVSSRLVPGFIGDPAAVDRLAEHIADFSIGGIRSLKAT